MVWTSCPQTQEAGRLSPGLGLLIVSSVSSKSAGCDSRRLRVTCWPLGLASSPLTCPITSSTIRISALALFSPQSLCSRNEDQRLRVNTWWKEANNLWLRAHKKSFQLQSAFDNAHHLTKWPNLRSRCEWLIGLTLQTSAFRRCCCFICWSLLACL